MKDKKQVLVIARWPVGGIRTYFRYIYSQEVFNDYQFTFVIPNIEGAVELLESYLPRSRFDLVLSASSGKGLLRAAVKTMRHKKYDLIHSHGFTAGLMALPLQWLFRAPHILTTHDVFSDQTFSGFNGFLKKWLMFFVLRSITKLMPVGADAQDNLLSYFPKLKSSTEAIRNGIPTDYFYSGTPRGLKRELGLNESAFLIGFFGRFMAQKGFKYLVSAVKELSQRYSSDELRVVCFGWGGFVREEQVELRKLGIESYFSFMPQTNDMPSAIKGVDLVAMPSLWEACPLLPMEVLSAGVPIVGTSCIGSSEVFNNTPAYVVEPRSTEGLVKSIREEMGGSRRAEFEAFASEAVKRFSSSDSARKLELMYQSLAN